MSINRFGSRFALACSAMATWDDVRRHATALPGVVEKPSYGGAASWKVAGKGFVWDRPLRPRDLADLGWSEQPGPVLGARVPDLGAKEALLAEGADVYFTTPHFDGYPSVLVHLERIADDELGELVTEAWFARAPATLARTVPRGRSAGTGGQGPS
jgi:hypothetical protein